MCGIVGFTGREEAAPILLNGLAHLEYRGYDSAGMAVLPEGGEKHPVEVVKARGKLQVLREMTDDGRTLHGTCGIGHTRWATHGEPSVANAHPHVSRNGRFAVVHNGIIENHRELRTQLEQKGYRFSSETDTEVIAHLLDEYLEGTGTQDVVGAIRHVMLRVRGSYALGILLADCPGTIFAVRQDSPLVVGCCYDGDGGRLDGTLIASDVPAILGYTRRVYYPENREIVCLRADSVHFYGTDADEPVDITAQKGEPQTIAWNADAAERGGFEHFMMKEIHEQPDAVRETVSPRIVDGEITLADAGLDDALLRDIRRVQIVACGSAYHAGMVGRQVIETLCRVPVDADIASEFRYRDPVVEDPAHTLTVVISQSGETADTLAALRLARERGMRVLAILNVVGSSMAREADHVLYTWAGPEIAVATTKAYSAQLAALYLLAVRMGYVKGTVDSARYAELIGELQQLPAHIQHLLEDKERIQQFAHMHAGAQDIFFIGRGLDYAVSLEGSLKLKEISYIHSEAYAAGELKHGTISLIEDGTLVVGIATQPALYDKTISNMTEVKSRGATLFGLTVRGRYDIEDTAAFASYLPTTDPLFAPSLAVIPLQLFAYYVSCARGLDVDKPRNLAKSVTVE